MNGAGKALRRIGNDMQIMRMGYLRNTLVIRGQAKRSTAMTAFGRNPRVS